VLISGGYWGLLGLWNGLLGLLVESREAARVALCVPDCLYHAALCARCSLFRASGEGNELKRIGADGVCAMILYSTVIHDAFRLSMRCAEETRQVQWRVREKRGKKSRGKGESSQTTGECANRRVMLQFFLSSLNTSIHSCIYTLVSLQRDCWSERSCCRVCISARDMVAEF
jgi:hypothetical protein